MLVQCLLQPGAGATRTERFRPVDSKGSGSASAPGVDTPAALGSSDKFGVALGAEPPNGFVVQEHLSVFHGL